MKAFLFSVRYNIVKFIRKYESVLNYTLLVLLVSLIVVYIYYLQPILETNNLFGPISEIIGIAIGFLLASGIQFFRNWLMKIFEDELKVNHSYKGLSKQFKSYYDYCLNQDEMRKFKYHCLYANGSGGITFEDLVFEDSLECFKPPVYVENNLNELLSCHKASFVTNSLLLRLNDVRYEGNKLVLSTMRTRNIFSLCMNRACDYSLDGVTLRDLYEGFGSLTPLNQSVFSNHIGIQVLLTTSDGYVILVERKKDSTVSKNGLCSSFATKFNCGDPWLNDKIEGAGYTDTESGLHVTQDLVAEWTLYKLKSKFKLEQKFEEACFKKENLIFLGLGQELYECGRPQLFFMLETQLTLDVLNDQLGFDDDSNEKYNSESEMYYVKPDDISFDVETRCTTLKNAYERTALKDKMTFKLIEDACLANLWHMEYYQTHEESKRFFSQEVNDDSYR